MFGRLNHRDEYQLGPREWNYRIGDAVSQSQIDQRNEL
jgi:hypothetical protein